MPDPSDSTGAPAPPEVAFDTGCLGCLLVVMLFSGCLFAIAAFDAQLFTELADSPAPRNWLSALAPFRSGGVNIAVVLLVAYIGWEAIRMARKFVDPRAVWIESETIRFHPSLRQPPMPLASLVDVSHDADDIRSSLVLRQANGRRVEVAMVDHEAAAAFVGEVERRLSRDPPSAA